MKFINKKLNALGISRDKDAYWLVVENVERVAEKMTREEIEKYIKEVLDSIPLERF